VATEYFDNPGAVHIQYQSTVGGAYIDTDPLPANGCNDNVDTYLTTTPTSQLDPGYIASQTAYLAQRLSLLQEHAGTLDNSTRSFEATLRKLSRDARALKETR